MIKKIILIISLLSFSFWNIFAYNLENIKELYIHKIDKIEQKIDSKYKDELKICYRKQNFYNKLDKILKLYEKKYTQYRLLFKVFLEINNYRKINIKSQCNWLKLQEKNKKYISNNKNKTYNNIKNNSSKENSKSSFKKNNNISKNNQIINKSQIVNNSSKNIEKSNYKLKFKLWEIIYDYNWNIKINTKYNNIKLPNIWKIQKIYDNFTIKVNNHWIWLKKISIITIQVNDPYDGINYIKKHYNKDFLFYIKDWNKYKYYLINKKDITILDPFDPSKSFEYNINQLKNAWYIYIDDFLYKKSDNNGIVVWWIFNYNNKLYYISLTWTWKYYKIPKDKILHYIVKIKKWTIITKQENSNNIIWRKQWIKLFYLWKYEIYQNIDLKRLWKMLNFTFYVIWKYNLPYNVKNMYDFINFTKQFEWKYLKDVYKRIIINFKYNEEIDKMLNEKWINRKLINNRITTDKKFIQNWDIFYTLKHKEWVCQSISDIFSIMALFYWKDADTIIWMTKKKWYFHQISKINGKYYDPTFDLKADSKKIRFNYFGMSKKRVEKYFNFEK